MLVAVEYGRLVSTLEGDQVVSPMTWIESDPITGLDDLDTLQPLSPRIDVQRLISFGLGATFQPPIVPRNGVLVLRFSGDLDPTTVTADVLNGDGTVQQSGTVQIRYATQTGQAPRGVPVDVEVHGRSIWVRTITDRAYGLPPSPLSYDATGSPRADATGVLKLSLPRGSQSVRTLDGRELRERPDALGETSAPIGFNPGNRELDFVISSNLVPTQERSNGFLPDVTPPRIVREFAYEGRVDLAAGDTVDPFSIRDRAAAFDTRARQGQGEWAGTHLVLRPGEAREETHRILRNTAQRVVLEGTFLEQPAEGDRFRLQRAEFYEPDPRNPLDPARYDPDNPENANNAELASFVEVYEIDAAGQEVAGPLSVYDDLPAFSEIRVRFSEPIDRDSLLPWETFQLQESPDPGFGWELLSRVVTDGRQQQVRLQPAFERGDGSTQVVGWGPGRRALRFTMTSLPGLAVLRRSLSESDVIAFLETGPRGITDLAGQPLAFSMTQFDPADPLVRFQEALFTNEAVSSRAPAPVSADWGVIVHRFLGDPQAGTDAPTGVPGARFLDQQDHYVPLADVNLLVGGRLAGQPVSFITKVHDDFFPPPDGQFGAFPVGTAFPLVSASTVPPPFEHNGARFQHVFRDVDASPGANLKGTLLDLYKVSFAPIGGNVTSDVYEDVSVHVAHSYLRPFTNQSGGGALQPGFGLSEPFDFATYRNTVLGKPGGCPWLFGAPQAPNVYDRSMITTVSPGTRWTLHQSNLFQPAGDPNFFHPWPEFQTHFQYNNGGYPQEHRDQRRKINQEAGNGTWVDRDKLGAQYGMTGLGDSLLVEYRVRPQQSLISGRNGFTFAPAILASPFPNFRAVSVGSRGSPLNPDNAQGDARARCATPATLGASFGDNSRYFTVFDYVKTTSIVTSPYVRVRGTGSAAFGPPIQWPPPSRFGGNQVTLEFEGAKGTAGNGGQGFTSDPADHDGFNFMAFRVRLQGSAATFLTPTLDLVAIPYRR